MLRKLATVTIVGLLCAPSGAIAGELPDAPSAISRPESSKKAGPNLQLSGMQAAVTPKDGTKRKVEDWQNLEKVRPSDKVRVVETNLHVQSGEFVAFSESDLTLRAAGINVVIPREQVFRMTVLGRGRGRNIKRGLLIGAGAGAVCGGILIGKEAFDKDNALHELNTVLAVGATIAMTVAGAGVGALGGAIVPPETEVYRSAEKPKTVASARQ